MKSILIPLILSASSLIGCSSEPPACSDPDIVKIVKHTVEESGNDVLVGYKTLATTVASVEVTDVVVSGYTKEISQRECRAMLKFSPNERRNLVARGIQKSLREAVYPTDMFGGWGMDIYQQFSVFNLLTQNAIFPDHAVVPIEYRVTKKEGSSSQYQVTLKGSMAEVYYRVLGSIESRYISGVQSEARSAVVPAPVPVAIAEVQEPTKDDKPKAATQTKSVEGSITRVDMVGKTFKCGEEGICFKSVRRTYIGNAYGIGMISLKALTDGANSGKTLCLRDVSVVDATTSSFEGAEICS